MHHKPRDPIRPSRDYTLTAVGRRIYARMGITSTTFQTGRFGGRTMQMGEAGTSSIVALDWNTQGKMLWEVKSSNLELPGRRATSRTVNFEGTPVADARNVYVAVTDRREETGIYVACFEAETGTNRWIKYLGTARPEFDQGGAFMPMNWAPATTDYHHRLLSLDGSTLYYLTNLGSVVAIDAETGVIRWVTTYPRQENNHGGQGSERDLNPAVVHEGKVIVAPSDANAIFAFDAVSGRLLWKTDPISDDVKLAHILGVAKGRLVATGNRVLLFDVQQGKLVSTWPDTGNKSLEGFGRGLLAGDLIYWPTQSEIQVLDQRTGLKVQPPIKLKETFRQGGGNLAAGDGYLIVGQADGLVVFCQNSRLIDRYRDEIVRAPDRATNYYRLARAAEAIGRDEIALDSYEVAIVKAQASDSIDGIPLAGAARDHLFRLLMRLAGRSRADHRWEKAIDQLRSASGVARSQAERLESRLLLAEVMLDAERPGEAIDVLEQILIDGGDLRDLPVAADGHRTIRADLLIADRLGAIVRRHGRKAYEAFDRQARSLYQRGKTERDSHLLMDVWRNYPVAVVVPDALEELGSLYETSGRLADAAHVYKRLFAASADEDRRARAPGRSRGSTTPGSSTSGAGCLLRPGLPLPEVAAGGHRGPDRRGASRREAGRPPYRSLAADQPQPPIPLPMVRRWHWEAPTDREVRAMGIEGGVPSLEAGRIVLNRRDTLRLLNPADGTPRWAAELDSRTVWAGYLADKLIAATPTSIVALDLNHGTRQWRFNIDRSGQNGKQPNPFVAEGGESGDEQRPDRSGRNLHGFRLVKGRLFCLRGANELIALDGDTGAIDWTFSAPPGEINPNIWIGADRVVLQLDRPNQLMVLRTEDGQPVTRTTLTDSEQLERPPLPMDDDSVLVVLDPRTVKKYDLNHGQIVWEYRESEDLPVNGPPRLLGDSDCVLVLHEGHLLIRLDPATGSKRWSYLLGTEDFGGRPGAMVLDAKRFYCINRRMSIVSLQSISLGDGKLAWKSEWSGPEDSSWSIALSARHVIAYPNHTGLADGSEMDTIPVVIRSRETGGAGAAFPLPGDPGRAGTSRRTGRGRLGRASGPRHVQDRPGRGVGGDAARSLGPRNQGGRSHRLAHARIGAVSPSPRVLADHDEGPSTRRPHRRAVDSLVRPPYEHLPRNE